MKTRLPRDTVMTTLLRAVCALGAVAVLSTSLASVTPAIPAQAVEAADSSSLTVKWAGGNSDDIQRYQVSRSDDATGTLVRSGHYADFKDLQVTVSKTKNVTDEALTVTASGLDTTTQLDVNGTPSPYISNFLQIMQCWGPDPSADDFRQTCQFGAFSTQADNGGVAAKMVTDAGADASVGARGQQSDHVDGRLRTGEPFRSVAGTFNRPTLGTSGTPGTNGLSAFFSSALTNERPVVKVGNDKKATTVFEAQSTATQPYLGCGSARAPRCWLVVVPRGTHSGTLEGATTACENGAIVGNTFGQTSSVQLGSPLDRNCSFWADRIVVPLDFQSTQAACPTGAPERRVLGTELASAALSSWQGALCSAEGGAAYSLITNPGRIVRDQLVTGSAGLALTLRPVKPDTVSAENAAAVAGTRLRYAPIANTGIGVAFVSERNAFSMTSINLSARLLAKLLTMSYTSSVPRPGNNTPTPAHVKGNPNTIWNDPELARVNPSIDEAVFRNNGSGVGTGVIVLVGPQGEDVVSAVWAYVRADDAARAFLQGKADEDGMRINPYFLPATNPSALGGGLAYDLAKDPVDVFPKADQTLAPDKKTADANYKGQQVDALLMNPYSTTLQAASQRIFRGNTGTPFWNGQKLNSAQEEGAWDTTRATAEISPGKHLFGPTDLPSAYRYGLNFASLQRPNTTEFVAPTDASLSAAVRSTVSDDLATVSIPTPADTPPGGYPLATTIYAASNVDSLGLDGKARAQFGALLDYAGGDGQTPGEIRGQLPRGYVPLTEHQKAQAKAFAALIRTPATPEGDAGKDVPASSTTAQAASATAAGTAAAASAGVQPSAATTVDAVAAADRGTTAPGIGSVGLGAALVAGLAGLLCSPFLLRRRGARG